jgi:threonine/homoserine/homoserine lactone efflux protein
MIKEFSFLITGIVFGLSAGISPGPLLMLIISETLKYNKREGIKVAIVPLITDLPIILITLLILSRVSNFNIILGIISVSGAMFIGYLAYENLFAKEIGINIHSLKPHSIKKGSIANLLSPHPYIFWLTIGSPTVLKAYEINLISVLFFIFGFYLSLVGSKIFVAVIVEKSRSLLKSKVYVYTIRFLGIVLLIFCLLFLREGLRLFGAF